VSIIMLPITANDAFFGEPCWRCCKALGGLPSRCLSLPPKLQVGDTVHWAHQLSGTVTAIDGCGVEVDQVHWIPANQTEVPR